MEMYCKLPHYGEYLRFPKKSELQSSRDPALSLLALYSKEMKWASQSDVSMAMLMAAEIRNEPTARPQVNGKETMVQTQYDTV